MIVVVFIKKVKSEAKTYHYLVQSYRVKDSVRQKTIRRLTSEEANDPNFLTEFLQANPKYQKTKSKAIILAAGKSRRLFPHSQDLPKALIPVDKKHLIEYSIESLEAHGITEIILITGFQDEKLHQFLADKVSFIHNPFYTVSGVLASLWFALSEIDTPLLIMYGDLIYNPVLISKLILDESDITVVVTSRIVDTVTESVVVKRNLLTEIGVKVSNTTDTASFAGIVKVNDEGAELMRDTLEEMAREDGFLEYHLTALLERIILKGHKIAVTRIDPDQWIDINTPQDLQRAEREIISNIR